jgi:peptide chain release factor subunit 1
VAPLTADTVRSLAAFKGTHGPVVSLYLDVDGQRYVRPRDYEAQLDHLLRQAREHLDARVPVRSGHRSSGLSGEIDEDLRRLDARVKAGIDRSHVRGLAVFSCSPDDFFEIVELPVPVRNQLAVNQTPHVRQLEALLERYRRYGVLVVDRQRARILVFQAGQLRDRSELFDELPRHDDDRGDWRHDHVRDHAAAVAQQHVRRAASVAFRLHQQRPLDHLILAGPDPLLHEMERELHTYLRERIVSRLRISTTASDDEIRSAARAVEADVERRRTDAVVGRLRDALGAAGPSLLGLRTPNAPAAPIGAGGGSGVAGLDSVLKALSDHRVDTLIVSDDFEAPGWRCRGCDSMATLGPACPLCSTAMERVEDVVEEAIEVALNQSVRLAQCNGSADLDVLGRIGALLRF